MTGRVAVASSQDQDNNDSLALVLLSIRPQRAEIVLLTISWNGNTRRLYSTTLPPILFTLPKSDLFYYAYQNLHAS